MGLWLTTLGAEVERNTVPSAPSRTPAAPGAQVADDAAARLDRELRAEQLRAAQELYRQFPQGRAAFVLGLASNEQGDAEAAIRYWREYLQLPAGQVPPRDRAEACASLGTVLKAKGEMTEAAALMEEALRLQPRRPETAVALAQLYFIEGRVDDARLVLDQAGAESATAQVLRGHLAQRANRLEEARRFFEEGIRRDPTSAEAWYGLAMVRTALGDEAGATEARNRFQTLKREQQTEGRQMRADYDPVAITRHSLAETHTQVGLVYLQAGDRARAESIWARGAQIDTNNTAIRFQLLMLYQQSHRDREALRVCEEMIAAEPRVGSHYLALGNLQVRLRDPAAAERAFRKSIELAPNRPEGYFALAQFYLARPTRAAEALPLAERAVALAPAAPHHYMVARAKAAVGDAVGARAAVAKAIELDAQNPQYRAFLANLGTGH